MNPDFDVVVVGAGPAGLAAALTLAKRGVKVVVFERGEYPGSKNMFGGMVYTRRLQHLIPDFWEDAPFERYVTCQKFFLLTEESSLALELHDPTMAEPPCNAATVLRSRFDRWLADRTSAAGALIVPGTVVDDVLWGGEQVVGVRVRRAEGAVSASLVIAADGVHSRLAIRAGLRPPLEAEEVAIGVKELWALPEKRIEERFGVTGRGGASYTYIGAATRGVPGAGFVYTNRESLSVGIVTHVSALKSSRETITTLLDGFKGHPSVRELLKDATLLEYSAHLVPEGGLRKIPTLHRPGMLVAGDAAGLVVSGGLVTEGATYAIASGILAAETALEALTQGDFGERALAGYGARLKESFVLRELQTFARAPDFLSLPRLFATYPGMLTDIARILLVADTAPRRRFWPLFRQALSSHVSFRQLAADVWKAIRALA